MDILEELTLDIAEVQALSLQNLQYFIDSDIIPADDVRHLGRLWTKTGLYIHSCNNERRNGGLYSHYEYGLPLYGYYSRCVHPRMGMYMIEFGFQRFGDLCIFTNGDIMLRDYYICKHYVAFNGSYKDDEMDIYLQCIINECGVYIQEARITINDATTIVKHRLYTNEREYRCINDFFESSEYLHGKYNRLFKVRSPKYKILSYSPEPIINKLNAKEIWQRKTNLIIPDIVKRGIKSVKSDKPSDLWSTKHY